LLKYPKKYCCTFIMAMFALLGGSVAQFLVPVVIAVVVDSMQKATDD
jgi:hypothetical protein